MPPAAHSTPAIAKPHVVFLLIAAVAGIAFAFATPPFQSPDEVGHYWRAASIGEGAWQPQMSARGPSAPLPKGIKDLVAAVWFPSAGIESAKFKREQWRAGYDVRLQPEERVTVSFPAFYTPVPSSAMALASAAGNALRARPMITYYAGRLANVALFCALAATAIAVTPVAPWAFAAAALLPMPLFLAGSWSTDPPTTGVVFLFMAIVARAVLRRGSMGAGEAIAIAVLTAAVALCKGAYVPVVLLLLAIPAARFRFRSRAAVFFVLVAAAALGGLAASALTARHNYYQMRKDAAIDPQAQLACIEKAPLRFGGVVASDVRTNGRAYAEQLVGRLGWLDIPLPKLLVDIEWVLILATAVFAGAPIPLRLRLAAAAAIVATFVAVVSAQYLIWTPVCSSTIEGVQGRYFVPLVPLVALAIGGHFRWRSARLVTAAVALLANSVAIWAVVARYY